MAQEPQHDQRQTLRIQYNDDDDDDEEVADLKMELEYNGFYDQIYSMAEKFATTQLGQLVIERCDRVLRSIEDTAKWSLPQESMEDKLVRPFNWIFFLSLIVALRFIRIGLSICALFIGNSPVSAHDVVYFIQTRRRKLRAIRLHGLKEILRREMEESAVKCGAQSSGFTGKVSALLSIAFCRPGQHREPGRRVFIRRGQMKECIAQEDSQACKRRRGDDSSDLNLTFDQMLSKYVDENSEDDPDFQPNPEDESSDDTTSSESENSSAEDQEDVENREISKDKETVHNAANNITSETDGKKKSQLNQSVEIKENGNGTHYRLMPKPFMDIKREPLSDIDSGTEQQPSPNVAIRNGNSDVEEHKSKVPNQKDGNSTSATNFNNKLNVHHEDVNKSTPGHESAAIMKPVVIPTLNAFTTVGSPTDFNACFKPVSILKNSIAPAIEVIEVADAHSTPKSPEDIPESPPTDASSTTSPPKKHVQHQQSHRNRNRGKNRR